MRISVLTTIVIYTFFSITSYYIPPLIRSTWCPTWAYIMLYTLHWVFCTICDCLAVHAQRVVLKVRWLVPTRLLLSYFIFKTERTEGSFILRQESPTILALFPPKKQKKRLGTSRELKRAWFDTEGEKIDDRKNGGKMSKGVRIERWDIFKLSAYSCLLLTNWLM